MLKISKPKHLNLIRTHSNAFTSFVKFILIVGVSLSQSWKSKILKIQGFAISKQDIKILMRKAFDIAKQDVTENVLLLESYFIITA